LFCYTFMIHFFIGLALTGILYPFEMHLQDGETAIVVVKVNGIKSNEGSIQVALFSSEASFPDQQPFRTHTHILKNFKEVEITFERIPFGEYAVAVYHDKNGNNKLDTNFMGIPKE